MRVIARAVAATLVALSAPLLNAPPAPAATRAITISGYAFAPSAMTINVGGTVTWTNEDQAPHNVTTTSAPVAIRGTTMSKGQSWSYTFTTPGRYSYICSIHPDMTATLTVVAAPSTRAAPAPRTRTVVRRAVAQPQAVRHTHAATTSRPLPSPSPSSTAVAAPAPADPAETERPLRPLLIVAGVIAAVSTLCLLMLASRPEPG
jgi:plastocyanin